MKKLIPFKKEIELNSLYEVTSISLEHTLDKEGNTVLGKFIVSGEYLATETSTNTIPFNYDIPFTIALDDIYDISDAVIDISDFYYEIVNNKVLELNIEVKLDNINEILIPRNDVIDIDDSLDEVNIVNECIEPLEERKENSIFTDFDEKDNFVLYKVYIVREGDTLDNIMSKYNVTKDIIDLYNDVSNIKVGDKIVIPYVKN